MDFPIHKVLPYHNQVFDKTQLEKLDFYRKDLVRRQRDTRTLPSEITCRQTDHSRRLAGIPVIVQDDLPLSNMAPINT